MEERLWNKKGKAFPFGNNAFPQQKMMLLKT